MNWKARLNPWGEVRRLREQNAHLEGRLEELREWAEEEVSRAFHRAADHYWQRNRMLEEQNKQMMQRMADIASLTPIQMAVPKSVLATMQGDSPSPPPVV